ncbi:hypothetical protein J4E08_12090 [Sagittula sp. NFXS13]|uniref:hypothetical protein n=1 Tax=Sagittula sp. NFXS13 TaxID=2819095 RepID=UPI0032DF542B
MTYPCAFLGQALATAGFILCAVPVLAERDAGASVTTFEAPALGSMRVIDPAPLYLSRREMRPFLEERRELMRRLQGAEEDATARARALTDLAEFHFAHAMAPEGLSLLASVDGAELPLAHRLRAAAFELALGLIDLRERPLTGRAKALLDPVHRDWADQPLFLALHHIGEGRCSEAAVLLDAAVGRFARFSSSVQERVLPGLLECAIRSERWRLAKDIAAAFDAYPSLRGSPAYHFLLGEVAREGEAPLAAFDSFVRAQSGDDLWAHRARRALVDLGLGEDVLGPDEAVRLLSQEAQMWRGGPEAAETLHALASLQMIAEDQVGAIETYGQLMVRHPGTTQASDAQQKARTLIDALYRRGAARDISLTRYMAAHERIAPLFRFTLNFSEAATLLADTFLAAGGTTIAAREYATIHDYLVAGQDLGIVDIPEGALQRLKVKEAEALAAGGQWETLGALLAQPLDLDDPDLRRRLERVSVRLLQETGRSSELLTGTAEDAPDQVLRLRAQARFDAAEWPEAMAAYGRLHDRLGGGMPLPDSIRYLLAAHRSGDMVRTAEIARTFPALTELPAWADISRSLTHAAPELLPLRQDTARARIESAGEVLETLPGREQLN